MRSLRVLGVVAALLAGAPAIAYAQWAYTAKDVHLRADRWIIPWSQYCRPACRSSWRGA